MIRVQFVSEPNEENIELWKIVGKKRYIGRYVFGKPCWVALTGRDYCEIIGVLSPNVVVVVCDQNGRELFSTNNGNDSVCFPTLMQEAEKRLSKYVKKHPLTAAGDVEGELKFREWLLSYKDGVRYPGQSFGFGANMYDDSWVYGRCEETRRETIAEWDYFGIPCALYAVYFRHTVCGAQWTEIHCGARVMGRIYNDAKRGTMYSQAEAREAIINALRSHFGPVDAVSIVDQNVQRNIRVIAAADMLLRGNYRRPCVERIVLDLDGTVFDRFYPQGLYGAELIRRRYPNCAIDPELIF